MKGALDRVLAALVTTDPFGLETPALVVGRAHEIQELTDVQFDP